MKLEDTLLNLARKSPWIKRIVRVVVWPVDLACTLLGIPLVYLYHSLSSLLNNRPTQGKKGLLFVSFGGGLNSTIESRGSLEPLINWDGMTETFDRTYWLMYRADKTGLTTVKEDEVYAFEQRRILGIFYYLGWLVMVNRGLWMTRKYPIKLVRSRDPFLCGLCGWVIARWAELSFCVFVENYYDRTLDLPSYFDLKLLGSRTVTEWVAGFVFRRADAILSLRSSISDWISRFVDARDKIKPFPHGVKINKFTRRNLPEPPADWKLDNQFVLSWAGRLEEVNFALDLARFTREITSRRDDVNVIIAGDGSQRNRMEEIISGGSGAGQVQFSGWIEANLACRLRLESDVGLVLMGGFSLLEAAASGCALLAYDVDWHSELVRDGETGWLIEEGRWKTAVDKVDGGLNNPDQVKQFGENARQIVLENHTKGKTANQKDKVYAQLLELYR